MVVSALIAKYGNYGISIGFAGFQWRRVAALVFSMDLEFRDLFAHEMGQSSVVLPACLPAAAACLVQRADGRVTFLSVSGSWNLEHTHSLTHIHTHTQIKTPKRHRSTLFWRF
jgi:hypothetical protein